MCQSRKDAILVWALRLCAAVAGVIVLLIAVFLVIESAPALQHVGWNRFWADDSWNPATRAADGVYNLTPMLCGTLAVSVGAMILAGPLGILSAVFCQFYAPPWLARIYRRLVELLAGIPSVVYGFWGLVVLAPLVGRWHAPGPSLLAGALILAVMIIPTIMLLAETSFASVPRDYLLAASALGFSRDRIVWSVVFPAAKSGIITAILLALVRALGETMAVLMVCGNVVQIPKSVFNPLRPVTATIAMEMGYAMGDHRSALFVCGLFLMGLTALLIVAVEMISRGRTHG